MNINSIVFFTNDDFVGVGVLKKIITTEDSSGTSETVQIEFLNYEGQKETVDRKPEECCERTTYNASEILDFIDGSEVGKRARELRYSRISPVAVNTPVAVEPPEVIPPPPPKVPSAFTPPDKLDENIPF